MDDQVRQVLEREYGLKIGNRLGRGGMAEVYRAESSQGIPCAIKVSFERLLGDRSSVQKELDSLQLVRAVSGHPHLVTLMDYWLISGFLVTRWELSSEGSLADLLAQHQAMGQSGIPVDRLLRYLSDAAEGIDFLNGQGIYHRDIKPHNLLLFHGRVKLADLGLAKFAGASTASHTGSGTLGYLPPEAYDEHRLCRTVDLYSLAASFVKLRTGWEPFGTNPTEMVERQRKGEPVLEGMSPDEVVWLKAALGFRPEDRPQEGAVEWIRSHPALRPPRSPAPASAKPTKSQPVRVQPDAAGAAQHEPLHFHRRQRVRPGLDTLSEAVGAAPEGTVLVLAAGEYALSQPLKLTKSLAVEAEEAGRSRIVSALGQPVLHLSGSGRWVLRGLYLEFQGASGDVLRVDGGCVQIEGCEFTGGRQGKDVAGAGVRITGSAEGVISNCQVHGNGVGILFAGASRGFARENTCRANKLYGIVVTRRAQPTLEGNQCYGNQKSGIAFGGTSSGAARENACVANKLHGIGVTEQARPTLEGNEVDGVFVPSLIGAPPTLERA